MYCEYLNLGRIRSNHPKEPPKNKAKSQANINLLLTTNYEDQRLSEKKRTQFVRQKPYF